ncbi:N-6 DNA methylase [Marinobacter sp.]|uniref:N-6 DNA methylase n=1 Tax=Marinobacter sp. TaxID=50741 RepID=UPI001B471722|nr:N-6 DNA methylase [Marinobacter sp.]MBQ0832838.1 N-6 DNA methylase [Marinobacter sp.]
MNLAQFYTDSAISNKFVSEFAAPNPFSILDIGCGKLGLLKAAKKRWTSARLIGYDIDPNHATIATKEDFFLNFGDGLDPDLSKRIEDIYGKVDLAVSNPPYISVDRTIKNQSILKHACILDGISSTQSLLPAELIFLAQNLLVMKEGSELGIILPSGFISGERWRPLRELLISQYSVTCCLELPPKSFPKTEVSTFALFIKKERNPSSQFKTIELKSLLFSESIKISAKEAANRLDYTYYAPDLYSLHSRLKSRGNTTVSRGNKTRSELNNRNITHFHTTDLKNDTQILKGHLEEIPPDVRFASAGDILISRVGTRCLGRAAYLSAGRMPVSDCILVIKSSLSDQLWNLILQEDFKNYLSKIALGAGAKYITKSILEEVFDAQ